MCGEQQHSFRALLRRELRQRSFDILRNRLATRRISALHRGQSLKVTHLDKARMSPPPVNNAPVNVAHFPRFTASEQLI